MTKYHTSDDGKVIDGKIVIFLKPPRRYEEPASDRERGSPAVAEAGGDGASQAKPGTEGGVKDGRFAIHVALKAAGGTPLAHERIRIHDPDTNQPVGEPAVTDDKGVLSARVPEEKEYQFFVENDAGEEEVPDPFADALVPPERDQDDHAVLLVALFDAKGKPVKGETVQVKDAEGNAQETTSSDDGRVELIVEPGLFTLQARGKSLLAHSIFHDELCEAERPPYKFVIR